MPPLKGATVFLECCLSVFGGSLAQSARLPCAGELQGPGKCRVRVRSTQRDCVFPGSDRVLLRVES